MYKVTGKELDVTIKMVEEGVHRLKVRTQGFGVRTR